MLKKKKPALKDKEKAILEIIHKYGGAMTANEIAERTGISYVTVKKYIEQLIKDKILIEVGTDNAQEKAW